MTGSQGGGGGGDKQFKQPVGPQPGQLTQEFTPLPAENWQADKKLFVKTCSNFQTLSMDDQKTLMKRYVSTAMWLLVEVGRGDDMIMVIKKVLEAYNRPNPLFNRRVQFLDIMIVRGESYISWMNRINQQAKLADLENIRAQEIHLMKFCQGLNKTDRLYEKLMELEVPSWARAQEIIKKHTQSMAQKAVLVDSAPKLGQG